MKIVLDDVENATKFLAGMKDCQRGKPHQPNQHPDYDRGYAAQYEMEQVLNELDNRPTKAAV